LETKGYRRFTIMAKSNQRLPAGVVRRLKGRPYYAYLYALNVAGGRLPKALELDMALDAQTAYLYARDVLGCRLPDFVHNALVLQGDDSGGFVSAYLDFVEKK
jgi:hypothetical protein